MTRLLAAAAVLALALPAFAQKDKGPPAPALGVAKGEVVKASKDEVVVRPRDAAGRFEKELTLRLTGTTRVTTLTVRVSGGKPVPVQQDADAKDLQPGQSVAVIYAEGAGGPVLLAGVVLPAAGKK